MEDAEEFSLAPPQSRPLDISTLTCQLGDAKHAPQHLTQ